jgi:hypothetical protein
VGALVGAAALRERCAQMLLEDGPIGDGRRLLAGSAAGTDAR